MKARYLLNSKVRPTACWSVWLAFIGRREARQEYLEPGEVTGEVTSNSFPLSPAQPSSLIGWEVGRPRL